MTACTVLPACANVWQPSSASTHPNLTPPHPHLQNGDTTRAGGPYCTPFSILADLCVDMPKMKGCEAHVALCNTAGSQASRALPPAVLLSSPHQTLDAWSEGLVLW